MEIIGYSERGAMNALFYGIAIKDNKEAMKVFLNSLNINGLDVENYCDFKMYMEFSLSDFGDPDLVIIADTKDDKKEAFFVEAKVSHRGTFSLEKQILDHNEYCGFDNREPNDKRYDTSNLFFQLRLKELFFETKGQINRDNDKHDDRIKCKKLQTTKFRVIGENEIVNRFADEIKDCKKAYYIAIIPEQSKDIIPNTNNTYGFDIHFITW